ncbi:MAG: AMP-binding protein [Burkholderiales bacterium]
MKFPLGRYGCLDSAIAWHGGASISVAEFLGSAEHLASRLPAAPYVFNLCVDRYHFLLGFAAALMRGQVSLLPPGRNDHFLRQIHARHQPAYCLVDQPCETAGLEVIEVGYVPARRSVTMPRFSGDKPAIIAFTSGSTGDPAPHVKTFESLVVTAVATAERFNFSPGQNIAGTIPPQHMYGLETTIMLPLQTGGALHSGHPLTPADIDAALKEIPAPRWLATTPFHIKACLDDDAHLSPLTGVICATMPLASELGRLIEARYAAPLFEIYGCTEAGTVATRRPGEAFTTCARTRIAQAGEDVWLLGGKLPHPIKLPDRIEVLSETEFAFLGRTGDMVKIAGKRASLAALNSELNRIPGVRDGVFYFPEGAQRLIAFAVAPGMTSRALIGHLRTRIDSAFLPRPLLILDSLPRNSTGKLPREDLVRLATAAAAD